MASQCFCQPPSSPLALEITPIARSHDTYLGIVMSGSAINHDGYSATLPVRWPSSNKHTKKGNTRQYEVKRRPH